MLWIFRALADRLKALFVSDMAQEFETQMLARDAERQADLLRQAKKYEQEGLTEVARILRQRALASDPQCPLAIVLPAIEHLKQQDTDHPLQTSSCKRKDRLQLAHTKKGR